MRWKAGASSTLPATGGGSGVAALVARPAERVAVGAVGVAAGPAGGHGRAVQNGQSLAAAGPHRGLRLWVVDELDRLLTDVLDRLGYPEREQLTVHAGPSLRQSPVSR